VVSKIIELPQGPALLLDPELLKHSGLAPGAEINVSAHENGLLLSPAKAPFDPAFLNAVEQGFKRYAETFRRLAE